jgi:zinc transporter 1
LVLGGHGHSHGPGEDHGHSHGDEHSAAEEGHSHAHGGAGHEHEGHLHNHEEHGHSHETGSEQSKVQSGQSYADAVKTKTGSSHIRFSGEHGSGSTASNAYKSPSKSKHRRRTSGRFVNAEDFSIHPASFRQEIIEASRSHDSTDSETGESESEEAIAEDEDEPTEESRLINGTDGKSNGTMSHSHSHKHSHSRTRGARSNSLHANHNHKKPKKAAKGGHGHNHADMGMNAMILHVIGDALGNVGVIVSALVIMFTEWSGKYYADPVVSLFITLIILRSTIPLTVASARILLQATPDHIDVNEVKEDIQDIPGVVSCHHVHIWQLSDTQLVASMHIQISFPISEAGGEKYMEVARAARKCLHEFGIHSATIQPEFCTDKDHDHNSLDGATGTMGLDGIVGQPKCRMDDDCLLECVADCKSKGCCSTQASTSLSTDSSTHNHSEHDHSAHDHSEHDGHSH